MASRASIDSTRGTRCSAPHLAASLTPLAAGVFLAAGVAALNGCAQYRTQAEIFAHESVSVSSAPTAPDAVRVRRLEASRPTLLARSD